mmetsp:Transcript_73428/g.219206  ORF Transcript_73428/g.219206 Transcript_73428/m.219206 type:complete len:258 (-) Transcript_73428:2292-3065(-)
MLWASGQPGVARPAKSSAGMPLPRKTVARYPDDGPTQLLTRPAKSPTSRTIDVMLREPPAASSFGALVITAETTFSPSKPPLLKPGPPAMTTPSGFGRKGRPARMASKGPSTPCGTPSLLRQPSTRVALSSTPQSAALKATKRRARGLLSRKVAFAAERFKTTSPCTPLPQHTSNTDLAAGCREEAATSALESSPGYRTGSKYPSCQSPGSKSTAWSTSSSTGHSITFATSSGPPAEGLATSFPASSGSRTTASFEE